MPQSACLIFNPSAGQAEVDQDLGTIRSSLEPIIDLDIHLTTPDCNANQLAREATEQGVEAVIVAGGDGTVSGAASVLVGTDIPLGIISQGTANAFAEALSIPDSIEAACQIILGGATRVVDTAHCNGQPMVLLAGIGFEAEMVDHTDEADKDRLGVLAYIFSAIQELRQLKRFEVEIETEDTVINASAMAVTIANTAPPTSILAQGPAGIVCDDGLLDLTIAAPQNLVGAIAASYDLLRSALGDNPSQRADIGYLRARQVKVTTNPSQKVVLDGEVMGTTPIEVVCVPSGLTIFTPRHNEVG